VTELPQEGGCLCGALRYSVATEPLRVTVCYCRFCQRATGGQGMVEPIFERAALAFTKGTPKLYDHVSAGSGLTVHVHFCTDCGTKTHLTFERWPDFAGVYAGTFDDPGWFDLDPQSTKFIFQSSAARGTLIPAGYPVFAEHAQSADGTPLEPQILCAAMHVTRG